MNTNIENYLILAQNALDGNNYVECDNYVNKVLEIDAINTDAYLLKIRALLVKQKYGYNEDEQKIPEFQFISNIEKQKSSCYSTMIDKCVFLEKHIKSTTDFVMEDFFGDYGHNRQKLHSKITSIDLLVYVLKKVNSSSDDEIVQAFWGLYEKAKNDDETTAKIFLKACSKNQKFNLVSKEIAEKFYRELIRIKIYDISYDFSETNNYTIKEMLTNADCFSNMDLDSYELSDIKSEIHEINSLRDNIRTFNPTYEIYDDEIIEQVNILRHWISGHYKEYAISTYNKIKRINPNYVFDESVENTVKSYMNENKQGCYIATCVYGSYDCPEVWTLRRYRDKTLYKNWLGKCFIKGYYFISPKLVSLFGETNWFKQFCKKKLDKFIVKLQSKGYENTKYFD